MCWDTEIVVSTLASTARSQEATAQEAEGTGGTRRLWADRRRQPLRKAGPNSGRRTRCRVRVPGRPDRLGDVAWSTERVGPPGQRRGNLCHGDREIAPSVGECPLLDIHQVQPVPTAGQALSVRQVRRSRPPAESRWFAVVKIRTGRRPFSSRKEEGRLVQPLRCFNGPVYFRSRTRHVPFNRYPGRAHKRTGSGTVREPARRGDAMEPHEEEEGWFTDPFGRHEARWLSFGKPTKLVRERRGRVI